MTDKEIINELTKVTAQVFKVHKTMQEADPSKHYHSIVVCWIDPFGNLSHRQGWFDEYAEANDFNWMLIRNCKKHRFTAWSYEDGELYWKQ